MMNLLICVGSLIGDYFNWCMALFYLVLHVDIILMLFFHVLFCLYTKRNNKPLIHWYNLNWEKQHIISVFLYSHAERMCFYAFQELDAGDITERLELKKRLGCKSLKWFLKNIYREKYAYIDPEHSIAWGKRRYKPLILTHSHLKFLQKVSSATCILLKITWE